jgi:ribosome-binding factor A
MAKIQPKDLTSQYRELIATLGKSDGLTPANLAKLADFKESNPKFIPAADLDAELNSILQARMNDPKFKEMLNDLQRKQSSDKIAAKVAPMMQAALAGTDITTALNQTRSARRAGLGLRRPIRPNMRTSRELQLAIDDARSRTNQVDSNVTNALKLNNLDSYLADLQNAKTASTGQAGIYGSVAQAAINRRNRSNLAMAPVMQQMLQQNRARYDELLGQQLSEQDRMNKLNLGMYGQDMYQYNRESEAIGNLEATGRSNTRNALYNMSNIAPGLIGNLATMRWGRTPVQQEVQPRYTPDTYELGAESKPYLDALQNSTVSNLYNDLPAQWNYRPNHDRLS